MRTSHPTRIAASRPGWQTAALLGAAGLAASFLIVQATRRSAEKHNRPQGKFVEVDGVRLHYIERGAGPSLVLLHGSGVYSNDFEFSGLLDEAAKHYRVIAIDRPGFGYSERTGNNPWTPEAQAKLLYNALHAIGVERPLVLGHSWGALVALAMALDYPRYLRSVALLSGYYYPSRRLDAALLATPAIPVLGHLLRYTVWPLIGRLIWPGLIKMTFSPSLVSERFSKQQPKWMSLRPSQLAAIASESGMMVAAARRLAKRYAELTMPVAIIAGSGDKIFKSAANAVRLHQEIKHSELVLADGVGHMPHYGSLERILEALARLDENLEAGGASVQYGAAAHGSAMLH